MPTPVVARALGDSVLDPRQLSLEMTESVPRDKTETSIEALNQLKRLAVVLALDDGAPYRSRRQAEVRSVGCSLAEPSRGGRRSCLART